MSDETATKRDHGGQRHRRSLIGRGALVVLVTVVAIVAGACSEPSHTDVDLGTGVTGTPDGDSGTQVPTTLSHPPLENERGGQSRLPLVAPVGEVRFSWQRGQLAGPPDTEIWVDRMVPTDDGLLAFGEGWSAGGTTGLLVWESTDGFDWRLAQDVTGVPVGVESLSVVPGPVGFVATGEIWDEDSDHEGSRIVVLYSEDGRHWIDVTPPIELLDGERLYLHGDIAVGPAGALVAGTIEYSPPEPPLEISYDGMTLVLDWEHDRLEIVDADGNLVYTGGPDEVHGGMDETDDGLVVYNHATGEPLFVMSWDVFSQIDEAFTDIEHGSEPGDIQVEVAGYVVTITGYEPGNPEGAWYEISDVATGSVVVDGPLPEFTDGPPPRFVSAAGTVILEFPDWETYWQAENEAYAGYEEDLENDWYTRPLALVSETGESWNQVDLTESVAANQIAHIDQVLTGPAGFVIQGTVENRDTDQWTNVTWTSTNGSDWSLELAPDRGMYVWGIIPMPSGLLASSGEGEGETGVLFSEDGLSWEPALVVQGEPGTYSFVQSLAADDLGAVVAIATEGPFDFEGDHVDGDDFEGGDHGDAVTTTEVAAGETAMVQIAYHGDEVEGGEAPPPRRVDLYWSPDGRDFYEIVDEGSFDGLEIAAVFVAGDHVYVTAREVRLDSGDTEGTPDGGPLFVFVGTMIS